MHIITADTGLLDGRMDDYVINCVFVCVTEHFHNFTCYSVRLNNFTFGLHCCLFYFIFFIYLVIG